MCTFLAVYTRTSINMHILPETGFLRLNQIIGQQPVTEEQAKHNRAMARPNQYARPSITPIIPVSASAWWTGIRNGNYPAPVKLGTTALWRVEDIRALVAQIGQQSKAAK